MNERLTQEIGSARWMRIIYRELDLTKEQNAPLYYPPRPLNGSMNLFSTLFQLLIENKIMAYRYEDGYEAFDEEHLLQLKEFLDGAHIYYEEIPGKNGATPSYIINESDIPSAEVLAYYVKEAWYFDQNNSVFDVKTLAICPLVTMSGDLGERETTPLFWLPYENVRPYISNRLIMTSNINNAKTFTMDDYFRRRMFDGEIIKTENLMNKTLRQYYPENDSLKLAQEEIEKQLETFRQSLYWKADSTQLNPKEAKKAAKTAAKTQKQTTPSAKKDDKSQQAKAAPAPKAERSAPTRSVRRQ
jgi:gliding motility associated protien GldN